MAIYRVCVIYIQYREGEPDDESNRFPPNFCVSVPSSTPHQRALVCGACTGTAQVGASLVSLVDSLSKWSRPHWLCVCLTWYVWHINVWWRYLHGQCVHHPGTPPYPSCSVYIRACFAKHMMMVWVLPPNPVRCTYPLDSVVLVPSLHVVYYNDVSTSTFEQGADLSFVYVWSRSLLFCWREAAVSTHQIAEGFPPAQCSRKSRDASQPVNL